MTNILLKVNGASIVSSVDGKITSGMVGLPVTIEYDNAWNGLKKIAFFRFGNQVRKLDPVGTSATVPWEILRHHGKLLEIGVEGRDADGNIVMPTVWCSVAPVYQGASGQVPAAPNPWNGEESGSGITIDDSDISKSTTWSSEKILTEIEKKLDDSVVSVDSAWSSKNTVDKIGIISNAHGERVTALDSSNLPFMGLYLYGRSTQNGTATIDAPVSLENVGDSGSVTVRVMGKNIADVRRYTAKDRLETPTASAPTSNEYGTTISATTGDTIKVTQTKYPTTSNPSSFTNGYFTVGFYCPLRAGDRIAISFDYAITENPLDITGADFKIKLNGGFHQSLNTENNKLWAYFYVTEAMASAADGWNYLEIRIAGTSGVFSNFQVEYGNTATEYEPYQEPQTLTIPTAAGGQTGLEYNDQVQDEIDLARGVLIHRVFEEKEYALPDDVMEAYAKLHTYKPITTIVNDAGAEMTVVYVADAKAYIDNKFNELSATLTALTGV